MTAQAGPAGRRELEARPHRPSEDAIMAADIFTPADAHQHWDMAGGRLRPAVIYLIGYLAGTTG